MASDTPEKPTEAAAPAEPKTETKPTALGEDDEFEDFPVDGMENLLVSLALRLGPKELSPLPSELAC